MSCEMPLSAGTTGRLISSEKRSASAFASKSRSFNMQILQRFRDPQLPRNDGSLTPLQVDTQLLHITDGLASSLWSFIEFHYHPSAAQSSSSSTIEASGVSKVRKSGFKRWRALCAGSFRAVRGNVLVNFRTKQDAPNSTAGAWVSLSNWRL
jgi:hypothetical protein